MSDVLTVLTSFEDISQLSQGFADRVEENQIILYGPTEYAEGDDLAFRVLLADESVGLEGAGIVTATYDGGEERDPEIRYDVVIAGLRLEGLSEVVFERLLVARQSIVGDEPPSTTMAAIPEADAGFDQEATTVASLEELTAVAAAAEPVAEPEEVAAPEEVVEEVVTAELAIVAEAAPEPVPEPVAEVAAPEPEPEPQPVVAPAPARVSEPRIAEPERAPRVSEPRIAEPERAPRAAAPAAPVEVAPIAGGGRNAGASSEGFRGLPPPNAPPVPPGFTVQRGLLNDQLGRPVLGSAWQPEARPREVARSSDGLFDYGGPIRLPSNPPRPDGLANGHVTPAPAPTTEAAYRAAREAAGFVLPGPSATAEVEAVDDLEVVGE